ncbi:MAG: hypothetical protein K1060chlam1_00538, partial [Candidatus Anoxychlamydiales bacterium]|nr:hypothetical protein [Candidatus Anoxychlamydiales bacterium]
MATRVDYKGVLHDEYNYKGPFDEEDSDGEMTELEEGSDGKMVELKVLDLTFHSSPEEIFKHSRIYFSHNKSFTIVPNVKELKMKKSFLKTQFVCGAAFYVIGDTAKHILFYTLSGAAGGMIAGAAVGGAVGGIATGGSGVVPGMVLGGIIGGAACGGGGLCYGIYKGGKAAKYDVKLLYRDFNVLKETEARTNKSMPQTIQVAHDFFMSFLQQIDKKEMGLNIFCAISHDIMIIPVKTNCGHVYELLSITNSLQDSKKCPMCKSKIKDITFDFQTIKAVNDALEDALSYLQNSAGGQNLLLLKKHVSKRSFSKSDNITEEKIRNA